MLPQSRFGFLQVLKTARRVIVAIPKLLARDQENTSAKVLSSRICLLNATLPTGFKVLSADCLWGLVNSTQ